jgi:hypothetical protein
VTLPPDPFGRSRPPRTLTRAGRVQLLAELAEALLEGRAVDRDAALFVGGAVLAWLAAGGRVGDLEREHLRIAAPRRSTHTPGHLWRELQAERSTRRATAGATTGSMAAPQPTEPSP